MKKTKTLFYVIILTVVATTAAFAGDYADLKFIGFSSDGSYMAFEESGEFDGVGGNYATTYFIDVEENKYALPPSVFEKWDEPSLQDRGFRSKNLYLRNVAAKLSKLKIVRGNTGKLMYARLLTDWTSVTPNEVEASWRKDGKDIKKMVPNYDGAFLFRGDFPEKVIFNPYLNMNSFNTDSYFQIDLKLKRATPEQCSEEAYMVDMTLQDNTHYEDLETQILQKDSILPKARHCPYGYHIEQVYLYKDHLAVFMNMFSQGFEGPDMRYMAVTGMFRYESN